MGESGGKAGAGGTQVEAVEAGLPGVKIYVAIVLFPRLVSVDEALRASRPGVLVAVMDPSGVSPCEAALALIYIMEDSVLGVRRIRDDNIAFLAYLARARQARQALESAGDPRGVVVASLNREAVEEAISRLSGSRPAWQEARCRGEDLSGLTGFRLSSILGK